MRVHSARPHGLGRAAPLPAHATERTETEEAGEGGRWKHTGSDRQEGGRMEGWRDGGRAGRRAGGDVRAPCASSPRSARNRSPPRSAPGRASASPAPSAGPPREMRGSVRRPGPPERRAAPRLPTGLFKSWGGGAKAAASQSTWPAGPYDPRPPDAGAPARDLAARAAGLLCRAALFKLHRRLLAPHSRYRSEPHGIRRGAQASLASGGRAGRSGPEPCRA